MPYQIRKQGNEYIVTKKPSDGKVFGRHSTRQKAERQIAALYSNEKKK